MINSEGEWVLQTLSTNGKGNNPGGSNPDLSNYVTINQMNAAIAQMQATDKDIVAYSDAQDKIITDKVNELNEESTVWGVLPE